MNPSPAPPNTGVGILQKMKGKHSGVEIVFKLDLKLKQSLTFIEGNFPEIFVNKEREGKWMMQTYI